MSTDSRTIFVVDDNELFLTCAARLLRASGFVVRTFSSAAEFLSRREPACGGCVVADVQMPGMDGIALQEALAKSANPLPIVFLTGEGDVPTSVLAMRRGAEDFLAKYAPKEELLDAIERALARDLREREERDREAEVRSRFEKLTPREAEVLNHVLRGQLNKQIAADLEIDERTVKRHRTRLMHKVGVESVAELVQLAVASGRGAGGYGRKMP